jgi:hypothetical protein
VRNEKELISICIDYLRRWNEDPILSAQLRDVNSPTHPAWHFYKTLFSINMSELVSIPSKVCRPVSFHHSEHKDTVTFFIRGLTDIEREFVIVPGHDLPRYDNYLHLQHWEDIGRRTNVD